VDCVKDKRQAERGCDSDAPFPYWTDKDGNSRSRCPRRPIFEDLQWFNCIISAYNFYKNGFLPHAGGMTDQAALFPFVMATIDDIMADCDKVERDKATGSGPGDSILGKKPKNG